MRLLCPQAKLGEFCGNIQKTYTSKADCSICRCSHIRGFDWYSISIIPLAVLALKFVISRQTWFTLLMRTKPCTPMTILANHNKP